MTLPILHTARVRVVRGQLQIETGIPCGSETITVPRAGHKWTRLILDVPYGDISIDALTWCRDTGLQVMIMDHNGPYMQSCEQGTHPLLRVAQVKAHGHKPGDDVTRLLIEEKIRGMARVVTRWDDNAATTLREHADKVPYYANQSVRIAEKTTTQFYWDTWRQNLQLQHDRERPSHWYGFEARYSKNHPNKNVHATDPTNAALNYGYAILTSELTRKCYELGLDPAFGLNHKPQSAGWNSQAMVYDMMEPARPCVDKLVLDYVEGTTFTRDHFTELRNGQVICLEPVKIYLASLVPEVVPQFHNLYKNNVIPILYRALHRERSPQGKYRNVKER